MLSFPEGIWTNDDAVAARDFFTRSKTGRKIVEIMQLNRPKVDLDAPKDTKYDQSIAMQTWEGAVNALSEFTQAVDEQQEEVMPQIDFNNQSNKEASKDVQKAAKKFRDG